MPTQAEINRALYSRPNKYGNRRVNGYASVKEANRAEELRLLQLAGAIVELQEQVSFQLLPENKLLGIKRPLCYVADFMYQEFTDRERKFTRLVVEDAKGFKTPVYKIKKRLMLQLLGIEIREV